MKKFISSLFFLGLGLTSTLAAAGPIANGNYTGFWCDYNVSYSFTAQDSVRSYGRMFISNTDSPIESYSTANGGIVIIRYLDGAYSGQIQFMNSNPPEIRYINGVRYTIYGGPSGGPFCKSGANILIPSPL